MLAVIIPAYNRGNCLREALKSLTLQTKKRFITVVVDDASQEDLTPVVNDFKDELHLVYLKQEQNGGPGLARKRGLEWCFDHNIELVMFLDSDDLLLPKAVERLSKEINVTNSDIIVSKIQSEDKLHFPISIVDSQAVWTHGKIYRVSYLRNLGLNFIGLRTNEDLAFNTAAIFIATEKNTIKFIDEELYLWRYDSNSITRSAENIKNTTYQLSRDFIYAVKYIIEKLEEQGYDVSLAFQKVIGIYTYVQILRALDRYSEEIKEVVQEIYNRPKIQEMITKQETLKQDNVFLGINQGTYFLGNKYVYEQNISDFIYQVTGIKI